MLPLGKKHCQRPLKLQKAHTKKSKQSQDRATAALSTRRLSLTPATVRHGGVSPPSPAPIGSHRLLTKHGCSEPPFKGKKIKKGKEEEKKSDPVPEGAGI